ncbi:hypothetical protein GCM10022409_19640 [Hymenobacter glaciei]|uniref:Uncharacterized protein n=1 Tax=Hymenobacter glaciei TaxID=877209 RepID=A0ABP7U3P6_9BACT
MVTLHPFTLLAGEVQPAFVYREGTYIAWGWDDLHQAVMLYQLPDGLFVELNYDVDKNEVSHLFAFEAGSE